MGEEAEIALARMRIELFSAIHVLTGDDLDSFWRLIDDIQLVRPMHPASFDTKEKAS